MASNFTSSLRFLAPVSLFMPHESTPLSRRREWIELGIFQRLMELALAPPNEVSYVGCTFIEYKQPQLNQYRRWLQDPGCLSRLFAGTMRSS